METHKFESFSKKVLNWILTCAEEMKSPWLHQYQSYINNWYINGKVFTSTTTWKPKKIYFFFSIKFEIEFWHMLKSLNRLSFVNISDFNFGHLLTYQLTLCQLWTLINLSIDTLSTLDTYLSAWTFMNKSHSPRFSQNFPIYSYRK